MANPNIVTANSLYGNGVAINLTTTNATTIIANSSSSGEVYRVNSLRCTNIDGSNSAAISVTFIDSSTSVTGYICYTVVVPPDTVVNILDKLDSFYLNEGDSIQAIASAANDLGIIAQYEVIS